MIHFLAKQECSCLGQVIGLVLFSDVVPEGKAVHQNGRHDGVVLAGFLWNMD